MKKLFTTLLLLLGSVSYANAANYDVRVGDVQVTDANKSNITGTGISGTVTFDGNKTLTLKNATINTDLNAITNSIDGLIIKIIGSCKVSGFLGIRAYASTTIQGDNYNASLSIEGKTYEGVGVSGNNINIVFKDIWATVKGKDYALNTNASATGCTLELNRCDVSLSQDGSGSCINGFDKVTCKSVTYSYNGNIYNTTTKKLVDSSGNVVTSAGCRAMLTVGRYILNVVSTSKMTLDKDNTGSGITSGEIEYDPSNGILSFNNTNINTGFNTIIRNYWHTLLDLKFKGTCNLLNYGGNTIYSLKQLTFEGASVDDAKLAINNTGASDAICLATNANNALTMTFRKISVSVSSVGTCLTGNGNKLAMYGCSLTLASQMPAVKDFSSCKFELCNVNTSETPVFFNSTMKGFTNISNTYAGRVVIDLVTNEYPLWVCGQRVTNMNASNILVEGLTAGSMRFVSYTNEDYFELKGVTLQNKSKDFAIEIIGGSKDFYISCVGGKSTINSTESAIAAFSLTGTLFIQGPGELYLNSSEADAIYVHEENIGMKIAIAKLDVVGYDNGLYSKGKIELLNYNQNGLSSQYSYQGSNFAIVANGKLILNNMDFDSDKTPGCYIKQVTVFQNNGTIAKKVCFLPITKTYDILVGGTPVTNCNSKGIGSPYITGGGNTAVTFDGDKTLTLNNATINYTDESNKSFYPLRNSGVDGLTIQLVGDNTINTVGYTALTLADNATTKIAGDGKLNATSSWYAIRIDYNCTLDIGGNVEIDAVGSSSGIANNNNGTNGETLIIRDKALVKAQGYCSIERLASIQLKDNIELKAPDGAEIKKGEYGWGVFVGDSATSKQVIFADKSVTAIDAVEVDRNADVRDIYDANGRQTDSARKGLNIIRMSDGTVKKVMVK